MLQTKKKFVVLEIKALLELDNTYTFTQIIIHWKPMIYQKMNYAKNEENHLFFAKSNATFLAYSKK